MKNKRTIAIILILLIFISAYFCWGNNSITVSNYSVSPENLPKEFDGFRIVQISDLHNKDFGDNLTDKIARLNPDIIVITGDIVDSYHTKTAVAAEFVRAVCKIAPVYYVTGNHESRIAEFDAFKAEMKSIGVNILENETVTLTRNGAEICLVGIDDPTFFYDNDTYWQGIAFNEKLTELAAESQGATSVLLSHRPELFEAYAENGFDVVLSGHAHGGQIRLPFIGGVFSPSEGFFPEYTEGMHSKNGTDMIISRGLGNSLFPLRVFNRPEIVVCQLTKEK